MRALRASTVAALAGWASLLATVWWWGLWRVGHSRGDLKLDAIPLYGQWDWEISWRILVPVTAAAALIALLPRGVRKLRWPWDALVASVAAAGWSLALAVVDPGPQVWEDVERAYGQHVELVNSVGIEMFVRDYTDQQPGYPVHLQAHPPGLVVGLWAASRAGLSGPAFLTTLALLGVAGSVVAALAVVRNVAGLPWSRAAAPFIVLVPAAVWHTNADVIFGGFALVGVACAVVATSRRRRRAVWLATVGGIVLGAALLLSYGAALMAILALMIGLWRRRWLVVAVTGGAAVAMVLMPLAWGFWWWDGLLVTHQQYVAGVAAVRGYEYFVVANLAVFALALGPATVVAFTRLRDRRMWIVVTTGLAIVLAADLSGLSAGETERIWQPFVPLVAVAGAALGLDSPTRTRQWLGLQAAVAVTLQAALRSPW